MKYLLSLLFISLFYFSCEPKGKQLNTLANHSWVKVDFANCYLQLPNFVKEKSIDEIKEIIHADDTNLYDTVRISNDLLNMLEELEEEYQVMLDTRNNRNLIYAVDCEYIKFSKELSGLLLGKFEKELVDNWVMQGKPYEKLDARYFQGARAQLIKMKFRLVSHTYESYYTQYIISNKLKTFQIVVVGTESDDYEQAILGMRI